MQVERATNVHAQNLPLKQPLQPTFAPICKSVKISATIPHPAIELISQICNTAMLVAPVIFSNQADHLLVLQAVFLLELVITQAGVGFPYPYNSVKNILTVLPLIQGKIVLF